MIDMGNDAIALLGHGSFKLNMFRREQIKPELKKEYRSLCSSTIPVTNELFGEDLSKAAKEVEEKNKISNKMGLPQPLRRPRLFGRINRPYQVYSSRGRGRGYSNYTYYPNNSNYSNNYGRGQQRQYYRPGAKNYPKKNLTQKGKMASKKE